MHSKANYCRAPGALLSSQAAVANMWFLGPERQLEHMTR